MQPCQVSAIAAFKFFHPSQSVREMREGDVLLLLAKPVEAGQLVQGRYLPFCERVVVREAMALI